MTLHPNTPKRLAMGLAAVMGVVVAFGWLSAEKAAAVAGLVAFLGTIWHPKRKD